MALGDLADACADLRGQALELETMGTKAVGLPASQYVPLEELSFQFEDPMAAIHTAADFLSSVEALTQRTIGRIKGLVEMMENADDQRSQAEDELAELKVSPEKVADLARAEVVAKTEEMEALQRYVKDLQENTVAADVHQDIATELQGVLEGIDESRAEVRSMLDELSLIAATFADQETTDLTYALEDLQALLAEENPTLGELASMGERLLNVFGQFLKVILLVSLPCRLYPVDTAKTLMPPSRR